MLHTINGHIFYLPIKLLIVFKKNQPEANIYIAGETWDNVLVDILEQCPAQSRHEISNGSYDDDNIGRRNHGHKSGL